MHCAISAAQHQESDLGSNCACVEKKHSTNGTCLRSTRILSDREIGAPKDELSSYTIVSQPQAMSSRVPVQTPTQGQTPHRRKIAPRIHEEALEAKIVSSNPSKPAKLVPASSFPIPNSCVCFQIDLSLSRVVPVPALARIEMDAKDKRPALDCLASVGPGSERRAKERKRSCLWSWPLPLVLSHATAPATLA